MAGVALITAHFDDGPIRRHLAALALLHARGFDRARRGIGEYMVGEVQDALHEQKLFDGRPMPQSKAAIRRKGKTLIEHWHLHDSYVYQLDGAAGVAIGSGLVYAAIHHFGGPFKAWGRKELTMPARPVLGMTPERERHIGGILVDEIRRAQA